MTPLPGDDLRGSGRDVTVIVCTYNRCKQLKTALESLAASEMPGSVSWEVLVVDNNSTDQTPEVVEAFQQRYPERFRYLAERSCGKSHALNTGIAHAHGDVLAFLDDDVRVEPTWLRNLTASLHSGEWAGAGGRTLPEQTFAPPPWLPDDLLSWGGMLWGAFDLGINAGQLSRAPYGANMAFRKCVFEKYGGFRIDLGPKANRRMLNEDTEIGRRLLAAGERLRYEPSAVVYHPVLEERVTKEYFFSWWFDYGRAMIREIGIWPSVCGIPRDYLRLSRCALEIVGLTIQRILSINAEKRFVSKCWVRLRAGMMNELCHRSVYSKRKDLMAVQTAELHLGTANDRRNTEHPVAALAQK